MNYWLFKTEPAEFGIDDLAKAPDLTTRWDQIRNYQARNFIRDGIKRGDTVFIYHSRCHPTGIVGLATVTSCAYPDPTQFDPDSDYFDAKSSAQAPRWYSVDVTLQKRWSPQLPLTSIKAHPPLQDMILLKQGRLSVQPVTPNQAKHLIHLAEMLANSQNAQNPRGAL